MNKKPPPTFRCELCGQIKEYRLCKTRDGRHTGYDRSQRFCSTACGYKGRRVRPVNKDGYVHSSGYRRLHFHGGKKAFQHRVIMAQALGRPLYKGENIHHKDGDRLNNKLSNLELWTKMQPPGQRVIDKIAFAIEILRLYPEFAKAAGVELLQLPSPIAAPG